MTGLDSDIWRSHIREAIGGTRAEVLERALQEAPSVSIRINPAKACDVPADAEALPWSPFGYQLRERPNFTLDPLFHAGCYYVQDSSAMFVGHLLRVVLEQYMPGEGPLRVLDLCAAPGGKTTDMAASLRLRNGGGNVLVANEVMRGRAAVLSDNVARWGDPDVMVTSCDPAAFARYAGYFDVIVADVPCSGEGMFRKDAGAVRDWSPDNVALCATRQRRILADVWPALREGGVLIYSTCTFNRSENDGNVEWICDSLGAEPLSRDGGPLFEGIVKTELGYLLIPGYVPGEGQYAAALLKTAPVEGRGETALERLRPLRYGVPAAELKGKVEIPTEDMALSLAFDRNRWPVVELDRTTALKYLHRDSFSLPDAPVGYVAVSYLGHPLGFVKNLGSRCNNLHPQGRRILMDIN